MTDAPLPRLGSTVLAAPAPQGLAAYYRELLGPAVATDEPDRVVLAGPGGGGGLSFQREADRVPPVRPQGPGDQQVRLHLDVEVVVPDGTTPAAALAAAADRAVALGGRLPHHQPQEHVRVVLDPVGHPFCLSLG